MLILIAFTETRSAISRNPTHVHPKEIPFDRAKQALQNGATGLAPSSIHVELEGETREVSEEQQEAWAHGWKEEQKPHPKVSLLEMLLYILDHRKANEAARNFHIRQANKSKEMAPVERKARRGEYVTESRWNGQ